MHEKERFRTCGATRALDPDKIDVCGGGASMGSCISRRARGARQVRVDLILARTVNSTVLGAASNGVAARRCGLESGDSAPRYHRLRPLGSEGRTEHEPQARE